MLINQYKWTIKQIDCITVSPGPHRYSDFNIVLEQQMTKGKLVLIGTLYPSSVTYIPNTAEPYWCYGIEGCL